MARLFIFIKYCILIWSFLIGKKTQDLFQKVALLPGVRRGQLATVNCLEMCPIKSKVLSCKIKFV